jgi:hypothetical protein
VEGRGNAVATIVIVVVALALAWYLFTDQGQLAATPPLTTKDQCGSTGANVIAGGYATVASAYGVKTSGQQICGGLNALQPYAKTGAYTAAQSLSNHVTVKTALLNTTLPATAAKQLFAGDFKGASTSAAETLTGANLIGTVGAFNAPTVNDLSKWDCPHLLGLQMYSTSAKDEYNKRCK